jgi:hypothetical protein
MALLMVVVLMALLSGWVLQALISARMQLRAGDERQALSSLRAAATDAAWATLRAGLKAGSSESTYEVTDATLPSGIATRTLLKGMDRNALPAPLRRPDLPLFGHFFTVSSQATLAGRTALIRGLACRLPQGQVRILAWVETP